MEILEFYASHSLFSDPGKNADMYEDLPDDAEEVCKILQGICLDFYVIYKYPIQNERWLETNNRYAEDILSVIRRIDSNTLTQERPVNMRFIASDSHFCTLFCSIMRSKGIPARKRVGVSPRDGRFYTYEICEYWDKEAQEWKKADPAGKGYEFIPAARAFMDVHARRTVPEQYFTDDRQGMRNIIADVVLDLAALNKQELLSWDRYGIMNEDPIEYLDYFRTVLDTVAEVSLKYDDDLEKIQAAYASDTRLQVPSEVFCDTPLVPPHRAFLK